MTTSKTNTQQIAKIIKETLDRERIGVEKAAEALGVSKQAVSRYQNGIDAPGQDKVAGWMESQLQWVRVMAIEIFDAMYPGVMQGILRPTPRKVQSVQP